MTGEARQRIDKWLFFTRMAKSRTLAQGLVEAGSVRINGQRCQQPSQQVKPGDEVSLSLERRELLLKVLAAGDRRGPYEEARLLYEDVTPPELAEKRFTPFEQAIRAPGSGRPVKKERRQLDKFTARFSKDD